LYLISEFCDTNEKVCILRGLGSEYIIDAVEKLYPNYPWHLELHITCERMKDIRIHKDAQYYMLVKPEAHTVLNNYIIPGSKSENNLNGKLSMRGCIQLSRDGLAIGPYIRLGEDLYPVRDYEITKINGINPDSVLDPKRGSEPKVLYDIHHNKSLASCTHDYVPISCDYNRYGRYNPWYDMNFNPKRWGIAYENIERDCLNRSMLGRDVVHRSIFSEIVDDVCVVNHLRLRREHFQLRDVFDRIIQWKSIERELSTVTDELALFILYCARMGHIIGIGSFESTFSIIHPDTDESREHVARIHNALSQYPNTYKMANGKNSLIIIITKGSEITRFKLILKMLNMDNTVSRRINPNLMGLNRYKAYRYHIPFRHNRVYTNDASHTVNRYGETFVGVVIGGL